jgi:ribokinase
VLELGVRGARVGHGQLDRLGSGAGAAPLVERDPRGDREDPGAKVMSVLEPVVGTEGAEERLLERVLGAVASEHARQIPEDFGLSLLVEAVERGNLRVGHGFHLLLKRTGLSRCETARVRVAVVGHVEWVEFARVERLPAPGEIIRASEWWSEAAGGGGVASVQLAHLAGGCTLYTGLGCDELGNRSRAQLEALGVRVEALHRDERQRRGFTFVDGDGERTITIIGEKQLPRGSDPLSWDLLAETDAAYFVSGDAEALRRARRARVVVATARVLETIGEAGVELDALVRSGSDPGERYAPGDLDPPPRLVVATAGRAGGAWQAAGGRAGSYRPADLPGPLEDTYGAGDSFAAGLALALGRGEADEDAVAFAARCAAQALARRGAHGRAAATPAGPRASG